MKQWYKKLFKLNQKKDFNEKVNKKSHYHLIYVCALNSMKINAIKVGIFISFDHDIESK